MQTLTAPASARTISVANWIYIVLAWLYSSALVLQLFAIGMVFLAGQGEWLAYHRTIGHSIGLLALALPLAALIGRLPRRVLLAALGLLVLYGLQFIFIRTGGGSMVRALHAVNAIALFWLANTSAQWARQRVSD